MYAPQDITLHAWQPCPLSATRTENSMSIPMTDSAMNFVFLWSMTPPGYRHTIQVPAGLTQLARNWWRSWWRSGWCRSRRCRSRCTIGRLNSIRAPACTSAVSLDEGHPILCPTAYNQVITDLDLGTHRIIAGGTPPQFRVFSVGRADQFALAFPFNTVTTSSANLAIHRRTHRIIAVLAFPAVLALALACSLCIKDRGTMTRARLRSAWAQRNIACFACPA